MTFGGSRLVCLCRSDISIKELPVYTTASPVCVEMLQKRLFILQGLYSLGLSKLTLLNQVTVYVKLTTHQTLDTEVLSYNIVNVYTLI